MQGWMLLGLLPLGLALAGLFDGDDDGDSGDPGNDDALEGTLGADRIETVRDKGLAALADPVMERWFTPAFRRPDNAEYLGYRNMLVRQPVEGYAGTCAAIRDADYTDIARTLTEPASCVVGDQDGSTPPALVAEMAKMIPDARYDELKDCGHIPCVEQPVALADIIRAFAAAPSDAG